MAKGCAAIALILLVAFSFGCGKSEKAQEKTAKTSVEVIGESPARPVDLPKDVPILKNATLKVAMSQGGRTVVHLYTTTSVKDAATFYNSALKSEGWTIESSSNGADMSVVSAKKGNTLCGVTIAREGKGTLIRLAISPARS